MITQNTLRTFEKKIILNGTEEYRDIKLQLSLDYGILVDKNDFCRNKSYGDSDSDLPGIDLKKKVSYPDWVYAEGWLISIWIRNYVDFKVDQICK